MTARAFLDTSVLVYSVDRGESAKRDQALDLLSRAVDTYVFVVSTQVMLEYYVTVVRKLKQPLPEHVAAENVRQLCLLPLVETDAHLVLRAIELSHREQSSLWDALIIQAALDADCAILMTEDLQHGRVYEKRLTVHNPFR